jgi:uncharacterized protein involved in exopolysaccharide biosynthesis
MRRILKLLARLYPSAWRNRYAAEYEALLDDATPHPQDAFNILWGAIKMQLTSRSFVRIVLPCTIAGALIAAAISFNMPPRYVSQFTFYTMELQGPTSRGARQFTEDETKQVVSNLRDITLDRDFLASTIQKFDLYPRERAHVPLEKIIEKMQRSIEVKPALFTRPGVSGSRSGLIIVNFAYSDPHLAQRVDHTLVWRMTSETFRRAKSAPGGFSQPHVGFMILKMASLPQKPTGWNRPQKTAAGLIAGLLCGLILATILSSRDKSITANI